MNGIPFRSSRTTLSSTENRLVYMQVKYVIFFFHFFTPPPSWRLFVVYRPGRLYIGYTRPFTQNRRELNVVLHNANNLVILFFNVVQILLLLKIVNIMQQYWTVCTNIWWWNKTEQHNNNIVHYCSKTLFNTVSSTFAFLRV